MGKPRVYQIDSTDLQAAPAESRPRLAPEIRGPLIPERLRRPLVVALLVCAGTAFLQAWSAPHHQLPQRGLEPVEVMLRGRIDVAPHLRQSIAHGQVAFHFPEIPLDIQKSVSELDLDATGRFELRVKWHSRRVPRWICASLTLPGRRETRTPRLSLAGTPPSCALPALRPGDVEAILSR